MCYLECVIVPQYEGDTPKVIIYRISKKMGVWYRVSLLWMLWRVVASYAFIKWHYFLNTPINFWHGTSFFFCIRNVSLVPIASGWEIKSHFQKESYFGNISKVLFYGIFRSLVENSFLVEFVSLGFTSIWHVLASFLVWYPFVFQYLQNYMKDKWNDNLGTQIYTFPNFGDYNFSNYNCVYNSIP